MANDVEFKVSAKTDGIDDIKKLKAQLSSVNDLIKQLQGQTSSLKNLFDTGGAAEDIRAAKNEIKQTLKALRETGGAKPITDRFKGAPNSSAGAGRLLSAIDSTQAKTSRMEALIQEKELIQANENLARAAEAAKREYRDESSEISKVVEALEKEYDAREKVAAKQEKQLEAAEKLNQKAEEKLAKQTKKLEEDAFKQEQKELQALYREYDKKEKQQAKDAAAAEAAAEKQRSALEKVRDAAREARKEFVKTVGGALIKSPMVNPFAAISKSIKGMVSGLSKLGHMVGRVLAYRALRKAFSLISQGVKEGIENLYAYSQNLGTVFHSNMDRMKESALLVKNATAAMIGPILNAVTPALEHLADLFANIANQIGFFIAKLTGAASFSAAIRGNLSSAAGAAKELKKQIFGFDELNILNAPSGGGASTNAGGYFEEWKTGESYDQLVENIKAAIQAKNFDLIGQTIAAKLNDSISKMPTGKWGESLGNKINNAVSVANGFLREFSFTKLGEKIGTFINRAIETLGEKDGWKKIGENAASLLTGAFDLIGGLIENIEPEGLGDAVKGILTGWFNKVYGWLTGPDMDWVKLGNEFVEFLKGVVTGGKISWGDVATSIFKTLGAAIGAGIGLLSGVAHDVIKSIADYFKQYIDYDEHDNILQKGYAIIEGIKEGLKDGVKGIAVWLWENIINPLWQGFKAGLGIDDSGECGPGKSFGRSIVESIAAGIEEYFPTLKKAYDKCIAPIASAIKNLSTTLGIDDSGAWGLLTSGGIVGTARELFSTKKVKRNANGGFVNQGDLFIANEAGPELVGTIGNKTAVTNQDQFTAGLYNANMPVVSAVVEMANAIVTAINNKDTATYLDGRELASSLYKPMQKISTARGPVLVR